MVDPRDRLIRAHYSIHCAIGGGRRTCHVSSLALVLQTLSNRTLNTR